MVKGDLCSKYINQLKRKELVYETVLSSYTENAGSYSTLCIRVMISEGLSQYFSFSPSIGCNKYHHASP